MITCPKCGSILVSTGDSDSRSEWVEEPYNCPECGKTYIRRTEYANGLVTYDKLLERK